MSKKVLVVAAHPDDEILGCGGTMARHAQCDDEVHVVFMADGVTSRTDNKEIISQIGDRNSAAVEACQIIGAQPPIFLGFPDNQMDTVPLLDISKALEEVVAALQPQIVYTHYAHDLNIDHQITHQAVMVSCRPLPGTSVSEIYSFEVLSSSGWRGGGTEQSFVPNYFVEVAQVWEHKIAALNCYRGEMRDYPRSIEGLVALATFRGVNIGHDKVEAFQLERGNWASPKAVDT